MGGSTPDPPPVEGLGGRVPRPLTFAAAALGAGLLAAAVFLIRAGGDPADAATWPITWELRSSDNGPLFQLLQDAVAGRPLDWRFSPQVFLVPELPLSTLAFALSGGSVQVYYLVVAALAGALLMLALLALVRVLHRDEPPAASVLRAGVAFAPLLVLPLIGTTWILSFHLAPTYYLGMYAGLLAAPVLVLARTRGVRIALGAALALTAASNPLALLFAAPGTAAALVLLLVRRGRRAAVRPAVVVGGTLVLALALRVAMSPLQGTSPFTYVDLQVFAGRLAAIGPYFSYQMRDPAAAVLLPLGAALAVLCLAGAVLAAVLWLRRPDADRRLLAVVVLGLVPLGGLLATLAVMITHYYYFWPVLVLPYVLVLLAVPRAGLPPAVVAGSAGVLVVALATGLLTNLGSIDRYLTYRSPETRCLDEAVAGQVGYATFSDARRVSLPSATGFRLIQIGEDLRPNSWLTNTATSFREPGTFFYVNGSGDERPIDVSRLVQRFGQPDRTASCSDSQDVLIYEDPAKLARIAEYYATTPPAPR